MKIKLVPIADSVAGLNATEYLINAFLKENHAVVSQIQVFQAGGCTCLAVLYGESLEKIAEQPVSVLGLSARPRNALKRAEICILNQLCLKTEFQLTKYRQFGRKALAEVKEKLATLGLELDHNYFPSQGGSTT